MNRRQRNKIFKDLTPTRVFYDLLVKKTIEDINAGKDAETVVKSYQSIWQTYAKKHNAKKNKTPVSERFYFNRIKYEIELPEVKKRRFSFFGKIADFFYKRGKLLSGPAKIEIEFTEE